MMIQLHDDFKNLLTHLCVGNFFTKSLIKISSTFLSYCVTKSQSAVFLSIVLDSWKASRII